MADSYIEIRGAREHNLKNINLSIPRHQLVVITGLSGSGKSSLAFDTIYAEGQRRYLESLSSYARQFLEKMGKPDVDYISGLSPSIAIEQKSTSHNPRSIVATVTEIYDYLRLLFAKAGTPYCFQCGRELSSQTREEIVRDLFSKFQGEEIQIFAPMVRGRKGEYQKLFQDVLKRGFSKARIDGKMVELKASLKLKKSYRHDIEVLVDHLKIPQDVRHCEESRRDDAAISKKPETASPPARNDKAVHQQLFASLDAAFSLAEGLVMILAVKRSGKDGQRLYSTKRTCPECQIGYPDLTPNMFSFNSPYGACPKCKGLGKLSQLVSGVMVDETKPLMKAINQDLFFSFNKYVIEDLLYDLAKKYRFERSRPFKDWPEDAREAFFWGDGGDVSGLIEELEHLFHETQSEEVRRKVRHFLKEDVCSECRGLRLKKESLGVRIQKKNIVDLTGISIEEAVPFFQQLSFAESHRVVTDPILKEIRTRLKFIHEVGLGYLTLDRPVSTLSGGELQRIRLAAQIGVGLTGVLYVLDEPSIGLHPRDNGKLLAALERLRDLKNTVIVVEHDEETMKHADYLIDLGPGAGLHGGEVVDHGTPDELIRRSKSLTSKYLSGELSIPVPKDRKDYRKAPKLKLSGCTEHNLKKIAVELPLGCLICVTGVSGSGKSTLIHDILYQELHNRIWKTQNKVGKFQKITGAEQIDKVIEIDQSPIGRSPRSTPATYTDLFGFIRKLFGEMQESKVRNYSASRFSFNLKGGRCEKCRGEGFEKLQMSFMPDIYVLCDDCRGKRYNDQTLEIKYRGKNISEVLDLPVHESIEFFSHFSSLQEKLMLLETIGLGYLKLGQPSTTLSGGEAQRIKLATELSKKATGKTLYLLDEPTTGLHFADVENLMKAIFQLRDQGNTIVIIEHHLDVIKMADYVLDLGPEGGPSGGEIIASGSPEEVAKNPRSYTGQFLKAVLGRGAVRNQGVVSLGSFNKQH
ncbi:MAG: excinuclease ABC subunit A [Candidatus Omnitrophica bacterium]|nr:excinuclease ABC subunit A [Candidatus Omnitrophota bacterium]